MLTPTNSLTFDEFLNDVLGTRIQAVVFSWRPVLFEFVEFVDGIVSLRDDNPGLL